MDIQEKDKLYKFLIDNLKELEKKIDVMAGAAKMHIESSEFIDSKDMKNGPILTAPKDGFPHKWKSQSIGDVEQIKKDPHKEFMGNIAKTLLALANSKHLDSFKIFDFKIRFSANKDKELIIIHDLTLS